MAVSAVFFLDLSGRIILSRNYRGDVPATCVEKFAARILDPPEESSEDVDDMEISEISSADSSLTYPRPIFCSGGISYAFIQHKNVYVVAVTKQNANAAMILTFLRRLVEVFVEYFKELEEESIRDNFVLVYELLDEMMDFGYPQFTVSKVLQEFITQESHAMDKEDVLPPVAVTNAVSWRSEGIRYKKNEVFLDVVESLNLLVAKNGTLLRSEIVGTLKMRCYLSGMPELKLGLNDKILFEHLGRPTSRGRAIEMEDVKFHQCVRLSRFEDDRTISFIPPDGEFELMSYRLSARVKPVIWVEAAVEIHSGSRVEYFVRAKTQFKPRSCANNVEIAVPLPPDVDSPLFRSTAGSVRYAPERDAFLWQIRSFPGGQEYMLRAHFGLPSLSASTSSATLTKSFPPISVKFEIPYFTVSGLQVRYLKISEKSGFSALPWVRYVTQSGDYQLRMV